MLLKSTIKELQCHRTMQEADFVELLRSSFPQLAGDDKALELFKSDRSRRLQRLLVKSLAPVEIYKNNKDKTLLYVRLKVGTPSLMFLLPVVCEMFRFGLQLWVKLDGNLKCGFGFVDGRRGGGASTGRAGR